jgi:hypothetical protein
MAAMVPGSRDRAWAVTLCPNGWWADFMIGSHHIHPYREFDEFNPGVGIECSITPQWAATAGYSQFLGAALVLRGCDVHARVLALAVAALRRDGRNHLGL